MNSYEMACTLSSSYFMRFLKLRTEILHKEFHRSVKKFREKFIGNYNSDTVTSWFPGHMFKGTLQLQAKLATVDCIIEVHDARIPFSGRNPKFYSMLSAIRPHILVLNKSDLADMSYEEQIRGCLKRENIHHIMFTNCKENKGGFQKVIPKAVELIKESELYNRGNRSSFVLMIIGIPNVGKSSLINRLRNFHLNKKSASAVGAVPGVTKTVLEKIKVSDNPPVFLLDTPGILEPNINNLEVGLKLAVCRTLKDSVVGVEMIADYLLFWLNKHKHFSYLEYLNLKEPTDDIRQLIIHIARDQNKVKRMKNAEGTIVVVPDVQESSMHFISAFRKGMFGKVLLDKDLL